MTKEDIPDPYEAVVGPFLAAYESWKEDDWL